VAVPSAPPGPLSVPPCPPGWRTGPPDFVGIGAQRSGSSWWYELVVSHPGVSVVPGTRKEVHFFDDRWDGGFTMEDVQRYHAYFPRPDGRLVGEWTPRYMYDTWTPLMLARAAPEAKLLAILRDPVTRYRSHLGFRLERFGRGANGSLAAADALSRGLYASQLQRVLRHFPREQLLVLQFERCLADPAAQLRRTYEFLGLDPDVPLPDLERPINAGRVTFELPADVEAELVAAFAQQVPALLEIVPDLDLELWPAFDPMT
jgi:hypothetical protein